MTLRHYSLFDEKGRCRKKCIEDGPLAARLEFLKYGKNSLRKIPVNWTVKDMGPVRIKKIKSADARISELEQRVKLLEDALRKHQAIPKTIEDVILLFSKARGIGNLAGIPINAVDVVREAEKRGLKVVATSASAILCKLCRLKRVKKFHAPTQGFHSYIVP